MQVAGLLEASQTPSAEDESLARDLLGMELLAMSSEGRVTRQIENDTQAVVAGTAEYVIDSDTFDVIVGMDNVAGAMKLTGATNETRVFGITRQDYMEITDKATQALPTRVFIERAASITLKFWPVPAVAGTFRFQKYRFVRDSSDSSKTADVDKKRMKATVWACAYDLATAKSMPVERIRLLQGERDRLKAIAKADDSERGSTQMYVGS